MELGSRRNFMIGLVAAAAVYGCRKQLNRANEATANPSGTKPDGRPAPTSRGEIPKRKLGRTGVEVSALGLGGFHIGQKLSPRESITLIRRAIDGGVTFLDNCWDYNDGDSEVRMGKALQDGYRQRAFLMTKVDGRTKQSATEQLEQSLRRLQTDTIDLVQIHEVIRDNDPERCFGANGTVEALVEARKAGKLRFIGFTGHKDPVIHLKMLEMAKKNDFAFDAVQMPLNVMDVHFRSFRKSVLPVLVADGIGVLGMKSMGAGDIVKSGVVSAEECLRYAMSLPTSVVICGMDSMEVLEQNVKTAERFSPYSEAEMAALVARTETAAKEGKFEQFKVSDKFDGTGRNPHWLEEARI
jgi:aryl-alcohol dehydrogenase-like predicted oxidoreductase